MHRFYNRDAKALCTGRKKESGAVAEESHLLLVSYITEGNQIRIDSMGFIIEPLNLVLPDLSTQIQSFRSSQYAIAGICLDQQIRALSLFQIPDVEKVIDAIDRKLLEKNIRCNRSVCEIRFVHNDIAYQMRNICCLRI